MDSEVDSSFHASASALKDTSSESKISVVCIKATKELLLGKNGTAVAQKTSSRVGKS